MKLKKFKVTGDENVKVNGPKKKKRAKWHKLNRLPSRTNTPLVVSTHRTRCNSCRTPY